MREVMGAPGRTRRWSLTLATVTALLLPLHGARSELPTKAILDGASRSVVQVRAERCPNGSRVGTGFLWDRASWIVTALHLVGGCRDIFIRFERQGIQRKASIARTLRDADLALLEVADPPDAPTLRASSTEPSLHEDLLALGYPLGVPGINGTGLKVSYGASRLKELLPPAVRDDIERAGSPSLSLNILRLEGHLLPGLSGAPIVNRHGFVVAVGDGGLENGAASISWGLPVAHVDALLRSKEAPATTSTKLASLFAAELDMAPGKSIRCGGLAFTKIRTRPFEDLVYSADDPASLIALTVLSAAVQIDISRFSYDIYQHLETGATIAVPAGVELREREWSCVSDGIMGLMTLAVRGARVTSAAELDARTREWEQQLFAQTTLEWHINPEFSYAAPQMRFDGLLVRRIALDAVSRATEEPAGEAFTTWMTRGDALTAVVARSAFVPDEELVEYCMLDPSAPDCEQYMPIVANWIALVVGVHLSTFPIG